MLTFQLRDDIGTLLRALSDDSDLYRTLAVMSEAYAGLREPLKAVATGGNALAAGANGIHSHLASLAQISRSINLRKFFASLEDIQRRLQEVSLRWSPSQSQIEHLVGQLDSFSEAFDIFMADQSSVNALPLVLNAERTRATWDAFRAALTAVWDGLETDMADPTHQGEISIVLFSRFGLRAFADKLGALDGIYVALRQLLDVPQTNESLRIAKIESGSLFVRLIGETKVIELMTKVLASAAGFIHRNYTREGRLASLPNSVEAIDKVLSLKQRLDEAGVDTAQMQDYLSKASVSLSRDLNELLGGESVVAINDQEYSIATELHHALPAPDTQLKLPNGNGSPPLIGHDGE